MTEFNLSKERENLRLKLIKNLPIANNIVLDEANAIMMAIEIQDKEFIKRLKEPISNEEWYEFTKSKYEEQFFHWRIDKLAGSKLI